MKPTVKRIKQYFDNRKAAKEKARKEKERVKSEQISYGKKAYLLRRIQIVEEHVNNGELFFDVEARQILVSASLFTSFFSTAPSLWDKFLEDCAMWVLFTESNTLWLAYFRRIELEAEQRILALNPNATQEELSKARKEAREEVIPEDVPEQTISPFTFAVLATNGDIITVGQYENGQTIFS